MTHRILTLGKLLVTAALAVTLCGCAQFLLSQAAMAIGNPPKPETVGPGETNRREYRHAVEAVYSALLASIEQDGRRILERDDQLESHGFIGRFFKRRQQPISLDWPGRAE